MHESIHFDRLLYAEDIAGSRAHARALAKAGLLSRSELRDILAGLDAVEDDIRSDRFEFRVEDEDIHMNVERALTARTPAGAKLHTGRSRNDQVALDLRLYLRAAWERIGGLLADLQESILDQAEAHKALALPAYTHLQRAQPVLWSHHLLAWVAMLQRDAARFQDAIRRASVSPLGSGACAGTGFPLDRAAVARELGLLGVTANSLDAVGDRDFVAEFLAASAILSVHLSRMAEELVLWSTAEFGFVRLSDAVTTGSSAMPQKRNPDGVELVRGKAGRVVGHLVGVLTLLKGLPLAYNKDLQEDKEPVFDTVETLRLCLSAMRATVQGMQPDGSRMAAAVAQGHSNATELADHLTRRGVPFREAHRQAGQAVRMAERVGCALQDLPLEQLRRAAPAVDEDVYEAISIAACLSSRDVEGGTAPRRVAQALRKARKELAKFRKSLLGTRNSGA